ncbi:MAG: 7TM-DISM domain-containing protein [Flammeovirgaceae bacterium]|nr:7TM-DISM domain-containing protein [Flammeovirgaceae bacterium]
MKYVSWLISLGFALILTIPGKSTPIPPVEKGIIDLRFGDLSKKTALSGNWFFYDSELLNLSQCKLREGSLVEFPKVWNEIRESESGVGYGTYFITILANPEKQFSLQIPQLYSSYALFVNNQLLAGNGKVGTTKETSIPQWLPQTVDLPLGDSLFIVLHISNFHHHKGGVKENIYIGPSLELSANHSLAITSVFAESGILIILALGTLVVLYVRAESKKTIFYFAMLCVSWALRSLFSNLYPAITVYPDFNWNTMIKIEYITLYLTMIWGILFLARLLPNESNKPIKYTLVSVNIFFTVFTIFTDPIIFTRWLNIYIIMAGVLIVYGLIVIIVALLNERIGVWLLVTSIFLGLSIFSYDVLSFEGIFEYHPMVFSVGYIIIFILMNLALLYHLKIFKGRGASNALTFDDLYKDQGFKY